MRLITRAHRTDRRDERLTWRRGSFWLVREDGTVAWSHNPPIDAAAVSTDAHMGRLARIDQAIGAFAMAREQLVWRYLERRALHDVERRSLAGALIVDALPLAATLRRPTVIPRGRIAVVITVPSGVKVAPIGAMSLHPSVDPADVLLERGGAVRIDDADEVIRATFVPRMT